MIDYLRYIALFPCAAVIGISICRLDLMNVREGALKSWAFKYILTAAYTFGISIDICMKSIDWYDYAGVIAFCLYLWHSRSRWQADLPPPESKRAELVPNVDSSYP